MVPDKMLTPVLLAGMIQPNHPLIDQIVPFCFVVFVIIAALTGQRQIVWCGFTAFAAGDDMLNRERLRGKLRLAAAVLAAPMRSFINDAP